MANNLLSITRKTGNQLFALSSLIFITACSEPKNKNKSPIKKEADIESQKEEIKKV